MPDRLAMDDVNRWLDEIRGDLRQAGALLTLGFERGNWKDVTEANRLLKAAQNRLANLGTMALPENWRILAERNGVHVEDGNDDTNQTATE